MKPLVTMLILLLLTAAPALAQDKPATPDVPKLTEVQTLKASLFKAKVEIAQLRATLADRENRLAAAELTKEQEALAAEFLAQTGAGAADSWDWATMTAKPKPAAEAVKK